MRHPSAPERRLSQSISVVAGGTWQLVTFDIKTMPIYATGFFELQYGAARVSNWHVFFDDFAMQLQ